MLLLTKTQAKIHAKMYAFFPSKQQENGCILAGVLVWKACSLADVLVQRSMHFGSCFGVEKNAVWQMLGVEKHVF